VYIYIYIVEYIKGFPECSINVDTLDLFFRRPDDDSIESKHVALNVIM